MFVSHLDADDLRLRLMLSRILHVSESDGLRVHTVAHFYVRPMPIIGDGIDGWDATVVENLATGTGVVLIESADFTIPHFAMHTYVRTGEMTVHE